MSGFKLPKGFSQQSADGTMTMKLRWNDKCAERLNGVLDKAQCFIDSEVLRRCDPYVPKDTGALIRSGITMTKIGSGEVHYETPYARRWYYRPAHFAGAPMRGNYWFERMKNEGGKESILNGAQKLLK